MPRKLQRTYFNCIKRAVRPTTAGSENAPMAASSGQQGINH